MRSSRRDSDLLLSKGLIEAGGRRFSGTDRSKLVIDDGSVVKVRGLVGTEKDAKEDWKRDNNVRRMQINRVLGSSDLICYVFPSSSPFSGLSSSSSCFVFVFVFFFSLSCSLG